MPQTSRPGPRRALAPALWRIGEGAPPSGPFVALVAGADAPLISLSLPASLRGVAREDVARRQVQDRLGAGFEVRPARLDTPDGWSRVAVADRALVLRWRADLGAAAARCQAILPDYLALPAAAGLWTIASGRGGLQARLGLGDGFSAEGELAQRMLVLALNEARATGSMPRAVLRIGADAGVDALFDGLVLVRDAASVPDGLAPGVLAQNEVAMDFARDPRADAAGIETRLRRMAWPVALVVLGALGWAGAQALAIRHDHARAAALEAETLAAVRRDLLGAGPILDLRVQVQRAIDARRVGLTPATAQTGPLELLRIAAPLLAQGGAVQSVYFGTEGVGADLTLSDFRALDALVAALAEAGVVARVTRSGIEADGGISAALTLEVRR